MKKTVSAILSATFALSALAACGSTAAVSDSTTASSASNIVSEAAGEDGQLEVITTIFPEYDWVLQILGDNPGNVKVTQLLDDGVDLHSYQPNAADMISIANCDMFIYVGGESDAWVEDALGNAANPDRQVIDLLELLGSTVKEEEVKEGMEAEDEEKPAEGAAEEEPEYDEHVWLSLKNADAICSAIADSLAGLDPDNADTYKANSDAYRAQLAALDGEYQAVVDAAANKTLLFGDRFPFRYLVDDYGLDYYAAFVGCSAETEASFETVTFLANKLAELELPAICIIDGSDGKLAATILQNSTAADVQTVMFDSMQSATSGEEAEKSYLSRMEANLQALTQALG